MDWLFTTWIYHLTESSQESESGRTQPELKKIAKKTKLKTNPDSPQWLRDRITTRDPRTKCTKRPNVKPIRKAPGTTLAWAIRANKIIINGILTERHGTRVAKMEKITLHSAQTSSCLPAVLTTYSAYIADLRKRMQHAQKVVGDMQDSQGWGS